MSAGRRYYFSPMPWTQETWDRVTHSKAAQELFGASFVHHFAASREWEEREFRRAVTDWELARYFEII